jgi:hypothetical protein
MSAGASRWELARHRLGDDTVAVALLWTGYFVFVTLVTVVVSAFRPIEISGWEVASQLPRWFVGGIGVYLTAVYLPLYIAHGYTRREFMAQVPAATVVTVALAALLMTVGYGLERIVYAVAEWPQVLQQSHLYTSADQYGLILLEFGLLFAVWATAGALGGAGFYRGPGPGLAVAPVALLMIGFAEAVLNPGFFEVVTAVAAGFGLQPEGVSPAAAIGVSAAAVLAGAALTWMLVRDQPIRSQRA